MMKKPDFKTAGKGIVEDLLNGTPPKDSIDSHVDTNAQVHKPTSVQQEVRKVRLHCLIDSDLDEKLEDKVRRMRRDRSIPKKKATRTAVVEAALRAYL